MPLVAFALVAYLAGLMAGYSGSPSLGILACAAAAVTARRRGHTPMGVCAALALAGIVIARASDRAAATCLERALRAPVLTLVLGDSAAPGAYVRGELEHCNASVAVSVDRGSASAGATVRARGNIVRAARGVLVQHARIVVVRAPSGVRRWRAAAGRAIDRTFDADAPLVRALLIADRHELSPEIRDRFAAAGLAHILAIAGLHIGIIAGAIELALELCGLPRQRASTATIGVIVLYVALIGAPIPAVRAAVMLVVALTCRMAQRPTSRWAIVSLGAAHPVIDPRVVLDVGYQLSVIGVAAMISAGMLAKRIGAHRLHWLLHVIVVTLIGTTVATIASAPIVAWVFGRVSVVAPLSNLAAGPLMAVVQPMVFAGFVLSPFPVVAKLIGDAVHPLLFALNDVAATASSLPHASVIVAPTLACAVIAGIMSVGVVVACASRDWIRPATIAAAACAGMLWLPLVPERSGYVELHMIDVGQGDAVALRTAHGHWILFDAGRAWLGGDAGRSTIVPYIGRRGGRLDFFVLSHPHTDHVGGAATVLRAFHPQAYIDAAFPGPAEAYQASLLAAREEGVEWRRAHPGDSLSVDGITITFLAPDSAWTASLADPNLASVVSLVRVGDVRLLLMGDAERPEEEWLLAHDRSRLTADVLKVGHHGSGTSSSAAFLDAVQPRVALVSVGAGNTYDLPTPAVLRALAARRAQVLRTDRLGTIVVRTDGHRLFVDAAGDTWELPASSPPPRAP